MWLYLLWVPLCVCIYLHWVLFWEFNTEQHCLPFLFCMKQSRCTKKYVFLKVVTSLRITALVNDDAGTNLSSQQGCFFSCVVWKGRLVWEEANQLYMSWEWRSKKKMSQTSFTTTLDKTCFLTPPYIRFLVQTEAAASNILSYLSFLSGSIWFTNTKKKRKEKKKGGTFASQLTLSQKHPCRAHMLSGTKCSVCAL